MNGERGSRETPSLFSCPYAGFLPQNKGLKVNIHEICVTPVRFPDINFAVCCGATDCPFPTAAEFI